MSRRSGGQRRGGCVKQKEQCRQRHGGVEMLGGFGGCQLPKTEVSNRAAAGCTWLPSTLNVAGPTGDVKHIPDFEDLV